MRGKLSKKETCPVDDRITPADAGKTFTNRIRGCTAKDHPRGCGENTAGAASKSRVKGSPPRMRGKLCRQQIAAALARITPADAGKTRPFCVNIIGYTDHPRGCGENWLHRGGNTTLRGSPPRMRGKHCRLGSRHASRRITPADAGKTFP